MRCPLQKRGLFRMAPAMQGAPNVRMSTTDTSTARDFAFMIGTTLISRPRLDLSPHSRWDMARAGETPCTVKTPRIAARAPVPPTTQPADKTPCTYPRPQSARPPAHGKTAPWRNPMHRENRPTSQHRRAPLPPRAQPADQNPMHLSAPTIRPPARAAKGSPPPKPHAPRKRPPGHQREHPTNAPSRQNPMHLLLAPTQPQKSDTISLTISLRHP